MTTYAEKYRDPRWQRKRLEVMQRAGFACQECEDDKSTLNVHHKFYKKGANPWEYDDLDLVCLCETCHRKHHDCKEAIEAQLAQAETFELPALHALIVGRRGGIIANAGFPDKYVTDTISNDEMCVHAYFCGHLSLALTDVPLDCVTGLSGLLSALGPDGFAELVAAEVKKASGD